VNGFVYGYTEDLQPITDVWQWAKLIDSDRRIARADLGCAVVRTGFLAMDQGYPGFGPAEDPRPFGTLVELLPTAPENLAAFDQLEFFYPTRDEALRGHARVVSMLSRLLDAHQPITIKEG
jgi:hypothetical protein